MLGFGNGISALKLSILLLAFTGASAHAAEGKWQDLLGDQPLAAWRSPSKDWVTAGAVSLDNKNPRRLASKPGKGILFNGLKGHTQDLVSKEKFGDVEIHFEFFIPKRSNSGIKLMAFYEIQISDSHGIKDPKASDCGGIYPRAELLPRYHHIDKGIPPRCNAAKPAGHWQTLDIIFQAPRFDAAGKKIAHAKFVKVVLNGKLVHENVQVKTPTGHNWRKKEVATGPILLQADHGPVAFRKLLVRPYVAKNLGK